MRFFTVYSLCFCRPSTQHGTQLSLQLLISGNSKSTAYQHKQQNTGQLFGLCNSLLPWTWRFLFWLAKDCRIDAQNVPCQYCAAQAADVVGHAEVWNWHGHQNAIGVHMGVSECAQVLQDVVAL